ncbi:hypothetical protein E2F47_23495 [Mycobacterium eburneum]|nr:hypothetical protein E2F47_23495 [Mycobacterium eburneum]
MDVLVYDKKYGPAGELNDYISLKVEYARNRVGIATIIVKGDDPLAETLLNCWKTVVPITIQCGSLRWSGRVFTAEDTFGVLPESDSKRPINYITLQCISDYAWLDKMLCWPNPLLPIQAQFPTRNLFIGPAITCIKTLIAEQALRLQSGIWEFVNNALSLDEDWRAWFGTLLASDGNPLDMLLAPIVVVPTDPVFDTSQWVSFSGRMDKCSTLIEQVVKDLGLQVTCDLWLPGDPQPQDMVVELTQPCIVVDVRDRSGVTGPSGTFLDGLVKDTVDLQYSILGNTLAPFLNAGGEYAPQGINIAPALGVNFVQPWVMFTDNPRGGLIDYKVTQRHPLAYTVIGGGKSPQWINDLINATFEFAIDAIQIFIGVSAVPSDILDGTLDDVFLAFWEIENAQRRADLGPFGFPEYFANTGSAAYTLDGWFALQGAMWDTRGFPTYQWTFLNGWPYTVGVDIFPGQLCSFARRGVLYTDYVDAVLVTDDRQTRSKVQVVVGDGKAVENPVVKLQRKLTKAEEAFNIITLSSN